MPPTFGTLLRRVRIAANLSQEALAEAARVSTSAIGSYERGVHSAPHRDTVERLADALNLRGEARADFERSARRMPRGTTSRQMSEAADSVALPLQTTSFVGRDADLTALQDLVSHSRCVTITGSGGIGKTRLAIELASRLKAGFADGVVFVDFGSTGDSALAISKIAAAINAPRSAAAVDAGVLSTHLKARRMLLVLDNCEHLLDALGGLCSRIIQTTPDVRILATSRERLRITAETVFRLSTLPVPAADAPDARSYAAIQLFIDRVYSAEANATFNADRIRLVTEICRSLDGIPLALELAAARVPSLGLAYLRDHLRLTLSALSGGARDMPTRQQTLDATLSWSFDLLNHEERAVLMRASSFAGGWTVEAAQSVCSDSSIPADAVCTALASLVEKSLVIASDEGPALRYTLLHVTRLFLMRKVAESRDSFKNGHRHADWLAGAADAEVALADESRGIPSRTATGAFPKPYLELENMRAALAWDLDGLGDNPLRAAKILSAFNNVWVIGGQLEELVRYARSLLRVLDESQHPRETALLWHHIANAALGEQGMAAGERAVKIFERLGDEVWAARGLSTLGWVSFLSGHVGRAVEALERASAIYQARGLTNSILFAEVLRTLSILSIERQEFDAARSSLRRAIDIGVATNRKQFVIGCRINLGELEFLSGNPEGAIQIADEAIRGARELGISTYEAGALTNRAGYRLALGKLDDARRDTFAALRLTGTDDPQVRNLVIRLFARLAAATGHAVTAARLAAFVVANNAEIGLAFNPTSAVVFEKLVAFARAKLDEEAFSSAQSDGARLTFDGALGEALSLPSLVG